MKKQRGNVFVYKDITNDRFLQFKLNVCGKEYVENFRKHVEEKVLEKYGKNIHRQIKNRLDWELSVICENKLSLYNFMIGAELAKEAKRRGWVVGNRGSIASSLVAHLIGITEINPLEAHYHCPKCHYVEFHNEFGCGVDMEDKVCQCSTKLEKDGFTIPPESFFGIDGLKVMDIDYNITKEEQAEATEYLEKVIRAIIDKNDIHVKDCGGKIYQFSNNLNTIELMPHGELSMIRELEKLTNVSVEDIPLDDKETMQFFAESKTLGIGEFSAPFVKKIMSQIKPQSFDDLIRISGLSHGTDVWTDNAEKLIKKGKMVFDGASCREDIMLTLITRGVKREEAYKVSEQIRKGKGLTDKQYVDLQNKGFERWQLDSWNRIKYLFPRAHLASYVLYAYRLAYYKAHYPLEFYFTYFNVHG